MVIEVTSQLAKLLDFKTIASLLGILVPFNMYNAVVSLVLITSLDLATKVYSIIKCNGFSESVKCRHLSSSKLWRGTSAKVIELMVVLGVVAIGAKSGLLPLATATVVARFIYSLFFVREITSIVENLSDAGIEMSIWRKMTKGAMGMMTSLVDKFFKR
jgi:phage-related holin